MEREVRSVDTEAEAAVAAADFIISTEYVFETPAELLTMTEIVFEPVFSEMLPEGFPEITAVPFTVIDAVERFAVGVTVTEETELSVFTE